MNRFAIATVLTLIVPTSGAIAQYTLVWSDEFDGTTIDSSNWEHQIGTGTLYGLPAGWGNNEDQYYTDSTSNSFVSGGNLHLVARRENFAGWSYTSARLRTKDLRDFTYGRFEARIQLPSGQGIWPAFWMLPTASPYGGWAASGELDIIESVNTATTAYGTAHYGNPWPSAVSSGSTYAPGTDFSNDFHEYAIEWEPDAIRWYVDDVLYHSMTSAQWFSSNAPGNAQAPFDVPFHLLINIAVGGNFPGDPNGGVGFPMEMLVDYVRVSQFVPPAQEPFLGSPHAIPGMIEVEDFDIGGGGVAYDDVEAANLGGQYRTSEGVDLEVCSEGGFNLGWVRENEWIEYTVDVQSAGDYQIDSRVASQTTGGIFHLEFTGAGAPVSSGTLVAPVTGGWQTWTTATTTVTLDAGEHVMRYVNDGAPTSEYNLNNFIFTLLTPPPGCTGDLDGDGDNDVLDFAIFAVAFGSSTGDPDYRPDADFNNSGTIDVQDFGFFGPNFGCTP